MSNLFKVLLTAIVIFAGFAACSPTETTLTDEPSSTIPQWYNTAGFGEDSLSFKGYASAISSDSVIAMANAELQARANLESGIARKLEKVREQLQENGSTAVSSADFIITLRNAHNAAEKEANKSESQAFLTDGYFTGFAEVTITRSGLKNLLESGFSGKRSFWQELSSSDAYKEEVE